MPSSRTRPGRQRRVEPVEHVVLAARRPPPPARAARTRGRSPPPSAAPTDSPRAAARARRVSTSWTAVGAIGLGHQRVEVAAVASEPGVLDEEERVAVGAAWPAGRPARPWVAATPPRPPPPRRPRRAASPVRCEPLGVPAAERLGHVGERAGRLGWLRHVGTTSSRRRPRVDGLDQQPEHPQGRARRPSAGRRGPGAAVACGAASSDRVARWPPTCGTPPPRRRPRIDGEVRAEAAQHLLPGPQRRRALVLRAAAEQEQGRGPRQEPRRDGRARRTAATCRCPARR